MATLKSVVAETIKLFQDMETDVRTRAKINNILLGFKVLSRALPKLGQKIVGQPNIIIPGNPNVIDGIKDGLEIMHHNNHPLYPRLVAAIGENLPGLVEQLGPRTHEPAR